MLSPLGIRPPRIAPQTKGKATRREVLVQCQRCGLNGTGSATGDRIVWADMPTLDRDAGPLRHTCGGPLVGFDHLEHTGGGAA